MGKRLAGYRRPCPSKAELKPLTRARSNGAHVQTSMTWKERCRAGIASVWLYRQVAAAESDPKKSQLFRDLAIAAGRQAASLPGRWVRSRPGFVPTATASDSGDRAGAFTAPMHDNSGGVEDPRTLRLRHRGAGRVRHAQECAQNPRAASWWGRRCFTGRE